MQLWEKVNEFVDYRLTKFQQTLVEEFNDRSAGKRPLRFQIADTAGIVEMVAGYQPKRLAKEIRFQDALQKTTPAEFEKLAAIVSRSSAARQYSLRLRHMIRASTRSVTASSWSQHLLTAVRALIQKEAKTITMLT